MAKVVLTQRADSGYDDVTGDVYHFPAQYLKSAQEAAGDCCLFYEARRSGGRMVYWAAGRITRIWNDLNKSNHYYAKIEDFLPFPNPVPFQRADGSYWERKLMRADGQPSRGAMGWSIRRIPDWEFELILRAGYGPTIGFTDQFESVDEFAVAEEQTQFERPIVERLSQRPFRDRVFAQRVQDDLRPVWPRI